MTDSLLQGAAELAEDARRLLVEIDQEVPGVASITADCRPPMDVLETATSLEVILDLPGVPAESIRVAVRRSTLLIVGAKLTTTAPDASARFHLAERSYGRFAREVRLSGAFDGARAHAVASAGLLRVILPRIEDRRGQILRIPVDRPA